jgi:ACS family pantothenate transporter-like MFS transporter
VYSNGEASGTNIFHYSKAEEISKRTSIFTSIGQLGAMFAGIMMTAIRKTMDGHGGMDGWRWVFIIGWSTLQNCIAFCFAVDPNSCADGLMGMPVGIFGLVCSLS